MMREESSVKEASVELVVSKICHVCGTMYAATDLLKKCPEDGSLLAPISEDRRLETVVAGRYVMEQCIGTGGWGKVYRARQEALNRDVAIKVLHRHFTENQTKSKRFQKEFEVASALNHPHIVPILDYGMLEDGAPYIVMELARGQSLDAVIKARRFEFGAVAAAIQIASALEYAQNQGLLHRDVKPSNIVFEAESETAKLLDFGIAKVIEENEAERTDATLTSQALGTADYMSPERCAGMRSDVRSDIYSLGCVLYEMLTGSKVFPSENSLQTCHKHISEKPRLFQEIPEMQFVPPALESVVMKCLDKDPALRYQSYNELIVDLGKIRQSDFKPARRRRTFAIGGSVSLTILLFLICAICMFRLPVASDQPAEPRIWTSVAHLNQEFRELKSAISILRRAKKNQVADVVEKELGKYEAMYAGQPEATKTPCVSAVSFTEPPFVGFSQPSGKADVLLQWTKSPMVLVLGGGGSSGASVCWRIKCVPGVNLKRVILVGEYQSVEGLPGNIPITHQPTDALVGRNYSMPLQLSGRDWEDFRRNVLAKLGLSVDTLQARYNYGGNPFVVGSGDPEWKASYVLNLMEAFYRKSMNEVRGDSNLSQLQLDAVLQREDRQSMGWCKIKGFEVQPQELQELLPPQAVAVDEKTGTSYLIWQGKLVIIQKPAGRGNSADSGTDTKAHVRVNPQTLPLTTVEIPDDFPNADKTESISFDSRRNRLLLATGEAVFYYDVKNGTWAVLGELPAEANYGLLSYSAADDCIYVFPQQTLGVPSSKLLKLSPKDATVIGALELSHPVSLPDLTLCKFVCKGGWLVVFQPPFLMPDVMGKNSPSGMLAINRQSGSIEYEGPLSVRQTRSN